MPQQSNADGTNRPAIQFLSIRDVLRLPDPEWQIMDMIAKSSLVVLFGPPGVGKSFLALSWAFAVASGGSWLGRKVAQGPVVYIAAEGGGGLKFRVAAMIEHKKSFEAAPCAFHLEPVQFSHSEKVEDFIASIKTASEPALIVVDTLARCFVGGDENSAKDMGLFIAGVEALKRETGATVLVVHHTGKNESGGARGSSALIGAADTMISCGGEKGIITLSCDKQKDAEGFSKTVLSLRKIDLGQGRSSCVVERFDGPLPKANKKGDEHAQAIRELLATQFASTGATHGELKKACLKDLNISEATFNRAFKPLRNRTDEIRKERDGQGARYFAVPEQEPVSVSEQCQSNVMTPTKPVSCHPPSKGGDTDTGTETETDDHHDNTGTTTPAPVAPKTNGQWATHVPTNAGDAASATPDVSPRADATAITDAPTGANAGARNSPSSESHTNFDDRRQTNGKPTLA